MTSAPGLFVLRFGLALVFIAHGAHKLFGVWGGDGIGPGGLDATAASYAAMGLEPGFILAVLSGVTQFVGGLLLAIGFLTRWAALALLLYVIGGIWFEHLRWGFFLNWVGAEARGHGIEYSIVLLGALGAIWLLGGGEWSIDGQRSATAEARAAAMARVRHKF